MKKAVFLDRDGVINRKAPEGQYVTRWEEMDFLPGVCEAIRLLNDAGFLVLVVSNQRCVAKGFVTFGEVELMHARMRREFETAGAIIDEIYYCPHETQPPCFCRKPKPGMLLRAAQTHDLDLAASWMIGDSKSDMVAGRAAGCNTVLLITGDGATNTDADFLASSLFSATHKILQSQGAVRRSTIN
ncbi:MAG: HAD family hydrolase [Terriglobales bacterium]|jgi:D-glycero-D-manno-heptose 1,7-bisphosphate phosphatase